MKPSLISRLALGAIVAVSTAGIAAADDFYKGRQVTMVVGYAVGGGFDLYARIVAEHLGRHIPGNPTILVQLRTRNLQKSAPPRASRVLG